MLQAMLEGTSNTRQFAFACEGLWKWFPGLWFVVSVFLNVFYLAANYWFNVVVVNVRVTLFVC